jgi:hypothetical protein
MNRTTRCFFNVLKTTRSIDRYTVTHCNKVNRVKKICLKNHQFEKADAPPSTFANHSRKKRDIKKYTKLRSTSITAKTRKGTRHQKGKASQVYTNNKQSVQVQDQDQDQVQVQFIRFAHKK